MSRKNKRMTARRIVGMAAVATAIGMTQSSDAGTTGSEITISLSGSTAMRNFTTNAGFTFVQPGTQLTFSNGTYPSDPNYWSNGGLLYQLAPDVASTPITTGTTQSGDALRVEWHEQGSVEGILDMINDQVAPVAGNSGTRDANTANPIWVNRQKFTATGTQAGYTLGAFGTAQGQSKVQMAISDVNAVQGFSTGSATNAAWFRTPGQDGYGKGNQVLASGGANNLANFGTAGGRVQLVDSSIANIGSNTLGNNGLAVGNGAWTNGGTANLENNKVAATATLFVANAGTGLDKLNRTDAQWLQTTGRFSNGANFNFTSRDVNSGTRNVAASNTGVDSSFAVGVNDGGTGASTENNVGSIKFSNKTTGGNLRTTVQNARMAVGTLGLSDALTSTVNTSSAPIRALDYADSVDGAASPDYVRASAQSIVDGSYVIWQNETYVTLKNPDAQFNNTNGANILGDKLGDVKTLRNNILSSAGTYPQPTNGAAYSPADALLANSFIPEQFLMKTKTVDGINTTSANPTYNGSSSADFLGDSFLTGKFAVGNGDSPNNVTTGASSFYASPATTGSNRIAVSSNNYLVGDFNQVGSRDLAGLQAAQAAQAKLFASGLGVDMAAGSNYAKVSGLAGPLANMPGQNGTFSGGTANTTAGASKGDLIVMGDFNADGKFDGKDLYLYATGAALADDASSTTLTPTGGETLSDAIKRGVLVKNAALTYLQTNATAQQRTDAAVTGSENPKFTTALAQQNAFNRFDVLRNGVVDLMSAAAVDKFVGQDPANMNHQLAAAVYAGASNSATLLAPGSNTLTPINLYQFKLVDGAGPISNATNSAGTSDFKQIHDYLNRNSGNGTNAVLLDGDTQFRGTVDLQDYLTLAKNFHTTATTTWSTGDFNFDGKVDLSDYLALAKNFHATGATATGNVTKAVATAATISGNASPAAAAALIQPAAGTLALEVDPSTGHLYLVGNNVDVTAYNIDSAAGKFVVGGSKHPYATLKDSPNTVQAWNVLEADALHLSENITTANPQPSEHFDLSSGSYYDLALAGTQLWTGTSSQLADLSFDYGDGQLNHHVGQVLAVPEPTTLGLLGLGAAGLLARRKRKA